MQRLKDILLYLLFPPACLALASVAAMLSLVAVSMDFTGIGSVPMYIAYSLMFYLLCVTVANAPGAYLRAIRAISDSRMVNWARRSLRSTAFGRTMLDDREARFLAFSVPSTAIGYIYAAFNMALGVQNASPWFVSVALYTCFLSTGRLLLLRGARRRSRTAEEHDQEWRRYRFTGCWMLLLNISMAVMAFQMVWQNRGYSYPGEVIYAFAIYAFYVAIIALVNFVKVHSFATPTLMAVKALDLAGAMMSMLALQTAMIAQFGTGPDEGFRQLANGITGGIICGIVLVLAIAMIHRGSKAIAGSNKV